MTHARQQIREAAKRALANLPTTRESVSTGDPYAIARLALPALVIVAADEVPNPDFSSLEIDGRRVALTVIGYAEGVSVEDQLDMISLEVETVLASGPLCDSDGAPLTKNIQLARTTKRITGDAAKRSGELHLEFAVDYRTAAGAPQTAVT